MPWAFIPVLLLLSVVGRASAEPPKYMYWLFPTSVPGLDSLVYLFVPVAAWLGFCYKENHAGVTAVFISSIFLAVALSVQGVVTPGRFDLAALAVVTAYLCTHDDAGQVVAEVFRKLSRPPWIFLLLLLPLTVLVDVVVHPHRAYYLGLQISLHDLVIFSPLILAAVNAPRAAYVCWGSVAVLSLLAVLFAPRVLFQNSALGIAYGSLGPAHVFVALLAYMAGVCIRRLPEQAERRDGWLLIALASTAIGIFGLSVIRDKPLQWVILADPVRFTLAGALLAGIIRGWIGALLATLASTTALALLVGWAFADAAWLNQLTNLDGRLTLAARPVDLLFLPMLAALFGVVGAEIRAIVLNRRAQPRATPSGQ